MDKKEVIRRVWQDFEPLLAEQGYELVEVEYGRQGGTLILRLFIDKETGISLDDCSAVSELLSPVLDAGDFVIGAYSLEVSSPGFDRPLRKPADFQRFSGEEIRLAALMPVDGRKHFRGLLQGYTDGLIALECDGKVYQIHIENLHKANLIR